MRRTDLVDLIQINDYDRNRTGGGATNLLEGGIPTYVAMKIPAEISISHSQQKMLERQPTQWEDRLICQHKIPELASVKIDYVYSHMTETYYAVDWKHTTSTNKTVSYRLEDRSVRETEYTGETWGDTSGFK